MHRMREDLRKEIVQQAELFGISTDEYVERVLDSYNQQNNYREVLLNDPDGFRAFIEEYHQMTDILYTIKAEMREKLDQTKHSSDMERVLDKLFEFISNNPDLLVRLYDSYTNRPILK